MISEEVAKREEVGAMSRYQQLVNRALGNDEFAKLLLNPETQKEALVKLGLKDDELQKALAALSKVDLEAIEAFRVALEPGIEIPI
jgi:hypothetical protein